MEDTGTSSGTGHRRRPQQLLLALLGTFVLDRREEPTPSRVFIELLGDLGVNEMATRATLSRMVGKGLLDKRKDGRIVVYGLTAEAEKMIRDAGKRVRSSSPFTPADDTWTLFTFSLPESRREARDQLRARLVWAGFGCLRDGLWIAPGRPDLDDALSPLTDSMADVGGFLAQPLPGTPMTAFVERAWDLVGLRAEHDRFLDRWGRGSVPRGNPAMVLTSLVADWLQLLRADPGLPARYLPADWPSSKSSDTYWNLWEQLEKPAHDAFDELAGSARF
ncbi:PaaX family transcriptional regulator [Streptomyces ochraceiscleroticus]|uniref:PaaX family transcriptional regulator C-terminal domain-containing protein n=1 Tax=Streptomyces ochraceiscleroticus TaxID=47761 RepID=A0ABW1MLA3_9ACTN|nr:PaaX family transcriptional regulator C-terminal domain-containing protein [Streptomyces ochraceiscleroticus]